MIKIKVKLHFPIVVDSYCRVKKHMYHGFGEGEVVKIVSITPGACVCINKVGLTQTLIPEDIIPIEYDAYSDKNEDRRKIYF